MKILSLFDGYSTIQQACKNVGINIEKCYVSEVDQYAIAVTQANFPNTIQLGSVVGLNTENIKDIDLLIGGSPCQDLSISKSKTREGLAGSKSILFYEYLRILREVKPKYFILENVASMSDESRDIISKELGVEPIELNARDFSAQDRARYFWTNILIEEDIKENYLVMNDILEDKVDPKYYYKDVPFHKFDDLTKRVIGRIEVAGHDILKRIYNRDMKAPTVTTCGGGNTQHKVFDKDGVRKLTPKEYLALQSMPLDYFDKATYKNRPISNAQMYKMCGNGFNCAVIEYLIKQIK